MRQWNFSMSDRKHPCMHSAKRAEKPVDSKIPCRRMDRTVLLKPEPSRRREIQRLPSMLPQLAFSRAETKSPNAVHLTFGMCGGR